MTDAYICCTYITTAWFLLRAGAASKAVPLPLKQSLRKSLRPGFGRPRD
jgi:hypothetical protein